MNLLEKLLDSNSRYNIQMASRDYENGILNGIEKFRKKYPEITEADFEEYQEKDASLFDISYSEAQQLIELEEEYAEIINNPRAGRFSNIPGGVKGRNNREKFKSITNKALVRRISDEFCYDDANYSFSEADNPYIEVEDKNDQFYHFIEALGYKGEDDSTIPNVIKSNYTLYKEKERLYTEVYNLYESNARMKYYLDRYRENPRVYDSIDMVVNSFYKKPISSIRKDLGISPNPDPSMRSEKLQRLRKKYDERKITMDVENKRGEIIDQIKYNEISPDEKTYEELFELGYDHTSQEGNPAIKSGAKLNADIKAWRELKKDLIKESVDLYYFITPIKNAAWVLNESNKNKAEYDPVRNVYNLVRKPLVKRGVEKGRVSQSVLNEVVDELMEYDEATRLDRLPDDILKGTRRDDID